MFSLRGEKVFLEKGREREEEEEEKASNIIVLHGARICRALSIHITQFHIYSLS